MRAFGLTALVLALIGSGLASRPAAAADFYMVYIQTEGTDNYWVELIDPATIATDQNGHRTVRAANISPMQLWNDEKIEFDCAGNRLRTLSSMSHQGDGTMLDRAKMGLKIGDWSTPKSDEIGGLLLQTVCTWSASKMTDGGAYTAPDFATAETKISDRLYELENKKH